MTAGIVPTTSAQAGVRRFVLQAEIEQDHAAA